MDLLLSLPLTPFELVIAKHISIYSMVLVTINVPLVALRDWHLLLLANGAALFLATVILSTTVVVTAPLAGQLPGLFLAGLTFASEDNLRMYYPPGLMVLRWIMEHTAWLAVVGLGLSPIIAIMSALLFKYRQSQ